jgi:HlyD family secretion protein
LIPEEMPRAGRAATYNFMAPRNRTGWIGLVLGALLVVSVLVGLAGRDQTPIVQTFRATRADLTSTITSNGKVEPIEPHTIRAQLDTFVDRVTAVEGQAVHPGELLLTLNVTDSRALLQQARADQVIAQEDLRAARMGGRIDEVATLASDLRKADIDVASLQRDSDVLKQLVAKHAATQQELDDKQLDLERALAVQQSLQARKDELARRASVDLERDRLRIEQAQDQIDALDARVRSAAVTSPLDGTLYSLPVRTGDYLKTGAILAEMADLHQVRVRAFVDEPDLGLLAPGQFVEVMWDAMPSRVWTGRTAQIPRQVVARGTRSVGEVLCSVDNQNLTLVPNVNVDVRIRVRAASHTLVVPRGAVHVDGQQRYVFLIEGNRLRRREVTLGISDANRYEILSGLSEGDHVALPGDLELHDGMAVRHTDLN